MVSGGAVPQVGLHLYSSPVIRRWKKIAHVLVPNNILGIPAPQDTLHVGYEQTALKPDWGPFI